MSRFTLCLMLLGTSVNFVRSQNYYYTHAREGEVISINCDAENPGHTSYSGYTSISPYLIVDEIQYTYFNCVHTNTYGIKDKCDNKTSCSFTVSNTIVGSSCGNGGVAGLWMKYHCVREGGWTQWNSYDGCSRTCGGGYQTRTRSCTNPPRNYFGTDETCRSSRDYETQRCNTGACFHSGSTCKQSLLSPTCNDFNTIGYMTITSGIYREGCSWNFNTVNPYHTVTSNVQLSGDLGSSEGRWYHSGKHTCSTSTGTSRPLSFVSVDIRGVPGNLGIAEQGFCNGRYSCLLNVTDNTLVSCYTDYYYLTTYYRMEEYQNSYRRTVYSIMNRYTSICGRLYWNYYCSLPQWTIWSSWSVCTVSCGRGTQIRTRSCENDRTTADGQSAVCAQSGSELHTAETRECLMTGSQPYCTYCSGAPDRFKDVAVGGQSIDTRSGNAILLESDIHIIRCCGVLTKITFVAMSNGTVTFVVWRPTFRAGEEHVRTVVGFVTVRVTTDNSIGTLITYTLQTSERIAVKAGDRLGWYDISGRVIGQELCNATIDPDAASLSSLDYRPNYCPQKNLKIDLTSISQGMRVNWNTATVISHTFYSFEWEIDASLDNQPTFSMSTTSVRIPDNTAIDTYVMNFFFNDSDNGDSFVDYQPDYNHSYFYFDSNDLSIRVKTTLPHTVGTPEVEHTFIIWAEDTCYNRVTGTVTITTYNVPPSFPDLPDIVDIEDTLTGNLYNFTVNDPSDGADFISCNIESVYPSTNMFELAGQTISLTTSASLSRDTQAEYTLFLSCSDGTQISEGNNNVTFKIRSNLSTNKGVYYYVNTTEESILTLTCLPEKEAFTTFTGYVPPPDPYIVIDTVNYVSSNHACNHSDVHGVRHFCEGQTNCSFYVTKANVGSSCGVDSRGTALIYVTHHCIRDGGWTEWGEWSDCSRTCGGGIRKSYRTFSNPSANVFSSMEMYYDHRRYKIERCNTFDCRYSGKDCRLTNFKLVCNSYNTKGYLKIEYANYTHGCAWNYNTVDTWHNVTGTMQTYCDNHYSCVKQVNDANLASCSSSYYSNSIVVYTDSYYCQNTGWWVCQQNLTDVVRHQQRSYCGTLYWKFTCTIPQWALWGEWSSCSVTCGRGIQTRTRSCDNEFGTVDGYSQRCNQLGSELHNAEERECPLDGAQPHCTYCGEKTYHTFRPLVDVSSHYSYDTTPGNLFLFNSPVERITCCGKIRQLQIMAMESGTAKFLIWRKANKPGQNDYYKVAADYQFSVTVGFSSINIPAQKQPTIVPGDVPGIYYYDNQILGYEDCDPEYDPSTNDKIFYNPNLCPSETYKSTTVDAPTTGDYFTWNATHLTPSVGRVYSLRYVTTPNTAPYFITGSVRIQDAVPLNSYVIDFNVQDDDFGDVWHDWGLDYDQKYFYLDTSKKSIYVKTKLFHEVGTKAHYYKYTAWAEDSCHNRVTGTVTITTYNSAPVFNDLPTEVNITEHHIGEVYTFNLTDADNDVLNWHIYQSISPNYFFYLENMTVLLNNSAVLDYSTQNEFSITFRADDGTETTAAFLIINLLAKTEMTTNMDYSTVNPFQTDFGAETTTQTDNQIDLSESLSGKSKTSGSIIGSITAVIMGMLLLQ